MSVEKIAAIKAKRLAKKRTTIKVDDDLEAGVLVIKKKYEKVDGREEIVLLKFLPHMYLLCFDLVHNYFSGLRKLLLLLLLF